MIGKRIQRKRQVLDSPILRPRDGVECQRLSVSLAGRERLGLNLTGFRSPRATP
jgi:hypothetical protein